MQYIEDIQATVNNKKDYLWSVEKIIAERENDAQKKRDEYIKNIFTDREKYISDLREIIGWPLNTTLEGTEPDASFEKISQEDGFSIYRGKININDSFSMYGLLFKKEDNKKRPLILTLHGKWGSPELVAGFFENDKGSYNCMIDRIMKYEI